MHEERSGEQTAEGSGGGVAPMAEVVASSDATQTNAHKDALSSSTVLIFVNDATLTAFTI